MNAVLVLANKDTATVNIAIIVVLDEFDMFLFGLDS